MYVPMYMHALVWGLSASKWTGTQLGSCMTATGETAGTETVSDWSETRDQRRMSPRARPHEQLTVGGTRPAARDTMGYGCL